MADPLVVVVDDLATYLNIKDIDTVRGGFLLQLAQDKCEAILSPLPAAALGVVLDVAGRAYATPVGSQTAASLPFPTTQPGTGLGGLWLTKANIAELRRLASSVGASGAFSIDPTPLDAGAGNLWLQAPETPYYSNGERFYDWDIPVA